MKKLFFFLSSIFFLSSCSDNSSNSGNTAKEKIIIATNSKYKLDIAKSEVTWERLLHQGPRKRKIKLFGVLVETSLDELKLNMSGNIDIKEGAISEKNDSITDGIIVFDMTTLKFNSENSASDDLFHTKNYPSSTFKINSIKKDTSGYVLVGDLTIADVSKSAVANGQIIKSNNKINFKGEMVIQTLNWPLRDEEAKNSTIKDEVTIHLNLKFGTPETKNDTTILIH